MFVRSFNRGRISSVGKALYSRGRTDTQGPKITENWEGTPFALQAVRSSRDSDDHVKMAVPSQVGDVKMSPIRTFVLNTLRLK